MDLRFQHRLNLYIKSAREEVLIIRVHLFSIEENKW